MKMIGKKHFVGVGGRDCVCCYHAPAWRKFMNRAEKRREKQQFRRDLVNKQY